MEQRAEGGDVDDAEVSATQPRATTPLRASGTFLQSDARPVPRSVWGDGKHDVAEFLGDDKPLALAPA